MTYAQAISQLPEDSKWSCSFGNPGDGGYAEIYRDTKGNRFIVANGKWNEPGNVWTCETLS